jgi:sugar phosphate isomerase/epimerase
VSAPGPSRGDLFGHIPYRIFRRQPELVLSRRVQPEIYLSAQDLEELDPRRAEELAGLLREAGLGCTIHAPFLDLNPGALDDGVRRLTVARHRDLLHAAAIFSPRTVVFHAGYDRWRYDGRIEAWLEPSLRTWGELLPLAGRLLPETTPVLENIYEHEPDSLRRLLEELRGERVGFCLDTGHFLLFGRAGLAAWLENLGPWLGEIHLHDNHGHRDEHLPPGEGIFPWRELLPRLPALPSGLCLTLEAHSPEELDRSLAWVSREVIPAGGDP